MQVYRFVFFPLATLCVALRAGTIIHRRLKVRILVGKQNKSRRQTRSASVMVSGFGSMVLAEFNLEIHVDVGPNGKTREMINDIVGMILANGFKVATKPASWGASHVADRHV